MDRKLAQDLIQQRCFVSAVLNIRSVPQDKATIIPIILAAKLLGITVQKQRDTT
jgi:hypothetical protein